MLIGYARVSTTGQNLDRQRELLKKAECEKVFEEKLTGMDRNRPKLAAMIAAAKDGDTVIITSLDRLARSTHDLFEIIGLNRKEVPNPPQEFSGFRSFDIVFFDPVAEVGGCCFVALGDEFLG